MLVEKINKYYIDIVKGKNTLRQKKIKKDDAYCKTERVSCY